MPNLKERIIMNMAEKLTKMLIDNRYECISQHDAIFCYKRRDSPTHDAEGVNFNDDHLYLTNCTGDHCYMSIHKRVKITVLDPHRVEFENTPKGKLLAATYSHNDIGVRIKKIANKILFIVGPSLVIQSLQ